MADMVYVQACKGKRWQLALRSKSGQWDGVKRVPFKCRSWRHEGECREWCGQLDFRRCEEALTTFKHWSFLVLTYRKQAWPDTRLLFRATVKHWYALRKRLDAELNGMTKEERDEKGEALKYIQTWEITQKGTPHVNIAISSYSLAKRIENEGCWVADGRRKLGMRWQWYDLSTCFKTQVLEPMQVASGFGRVSTLEPLNDSARLAAYMTKLAGELTGAARKNQVPINAPPHFRRIRASRHTLPPRKHNEDVTGEVEYSPHQSASAEAWAAHGKKMAARAAARAASAALLR